MLELRLIASQASVAWLSDALMELDALAVSVLDADANTDAERALFGEPDMPVAEEAWQSSLLQALFVDREHLDHALQVLQLQPEWGQTRQAGVHTVADEDWVRLTQLQFQPIEITPNFWIVPSWHDVPSQASTVIRLDPGLAFGTGSHPTTRMCLGWMAEHPERVKGTAVMDYGCGSGVLAIGAALLGAAEVHGVDIDAAALQASLNNAQANGVTISVRDAAAPGPVDERFDVVLANILAMPLRVLAPALCKLLKPGAHLVLAGILERQGAELQAAYAPWLSLEVTREMDGWILMTGRRS